MKYANVFSLQKNLISLCYSFCIFLFSICILFSFLYTLLALFITLSFPFARCKRSRTLHPRKEHFLYPLLLSDILVRPTAMYFFFNCQITFRKVLYTVFVILSLHFIQNSSLFRNFHVTLNVTSLHFALTSCTLFDTLSVCIITFSLLFLSYILYRTFFKF